MQQQDEARRKLIDAQNKVEIVTEDNVNLKKVEVEETQKIFDQAIAIRRDFEKRIALESGKGSKTAIAERIRQLEQEQNLRPVPIVALTAHALREQQQRCISAGMDEYLAKPLTFERLKQMLVQQFCRNGARN